MRVERFAVSGPFWELTTDPSAIKAWAGVTCIRRMIAATFEDAVEKGCFCWNSVLSGINSIILMSSLGCHPGDIAQTRIVYKNVAGLSQRHLRWEHVRATASLPYSSA